MSLSTSASAVPMPEVRSTPPNMPPAPVMSTTEQIGPSAVSRMRSSAVPSTPRRRPSTKAATNTEMSSAMELVPMSDMAWYHQVVSSTTPTERSEFRPVFIRMSTSGRASRAMTVPAFGGFVGWTSSSGPPNSESTGSGMRLLMNLAHR